MSVDLETRTKAALRQFDSNMSGIFDRASFYDQELYSQAAYPQLTRAQMCFKYTLFAANLLFLVSRINSHPCIASFNHSINQSDASNYLLCISFNSQSVYV